MTELALRGGPLGLIGDTLRLWCRYLPQLLAVALAGVLLNELLLQAAVWIGYQNRLAGLLSLTLVVLVKLVIFVLLFETLRPALPGIASAALADQADATTAQDEGRARWRRLSAIVSQALVPFFAYYAAWGFLGETIRAYGREGLGQFNPFDPTYRGSLFEVSGGWWLAASVALLWLIRRGAKKQKQRSAHPAWNVLIVLCEAGWTFVGMYVLTEWKGGVFRWLAHLRIADLGQQLWQGISHPIGVAHAALPGAVEQAPPGVADTLVVIFFSALLPVVWLALAALIYRYDVHNAEWNAPGKWSSKVDGTLGLWRKLPTWLRDFIGHFWAGTVSRYRAAANSVQLAGATGLAALVTLIVLYRALDWASAWAWMGLTRLIGPHPQVVWQTIANQLSVVLGTPSDPGDGLLPQTLKICLLAATLERAFRAGRSWRALK
ncbi:hypothetical protein [Xanthomonas sp. LMG 12460]|uniref:hypothetical protein n=1 Tax=Xanthomonas sp. LMG 12460 TaxID=1591132 RepID=UPI0012658EEF|nr:hypothetical protein [Xanthomonas sp. LMG 12460]KAB7779808.1 hypothetical protein CEK66_05855 [Xanthomonas sp. LMG 12460]